jgi:hypothetical protein
MKTASGDERDLDAVRDRVDQRVTMRVGHTAAAVEQRTVDVDGQEARHRTGIEV